MTRSQRNALLAVALAIAAGLSAWLWWAVQSPAPVRPPPPPPTQASAAPVSPQTEPLDAAPEERTELEAEAPPAEPETTVVFPLEVDLELVRSDVVLRAEGEPPLGSAATARLRGSVKSTSGTGIRAEITFPTGSNAGRVLYADREGVFGANDLYPGLALVEVRGPGVISLREVRLRQDRDSQLHLVYGRPAVVHGEVLTNDASPIADARVTMDGQETRTDERGQFVFDRMTAGEVIVVVEKPGYAAYRESITVPADRTIEPGRLKYVLQRGARLEISIAEAINPGFEAQVFLLPSNAKAQRRFPWFAVNPVRVYPGGTKIVEDLPAEPIDIRLFHVGAIAEPRVRSLSLQAGESGSVVLHLEPAPQLMGVVRSGGLVIAGAHVRMEPPDQVNATMAALNVRDYLLLESELFPKLPTAVQETVSDGNGQFWLTAYEELSKVRYLVATSPDGKQSGGVVLHGGENEVAVELHPTQSGSAELVLELDKRFQALPIKLTVDGTPREVAPLPAGQDLHIGDLTPGTWRLRVRWDESTLVDGQSLDIKSSLSWSVTLPEGAILGQEEDIRKRAQRRQ
jgi:hypothetical protein